MICQPFQTYGLRFLNSGLFNKMSKPTTRTFLNELQAIPGLMWNFFGTNVSPSTGTIYAVSSGAPPAGVSVIRVSGPESANILRAMTKSETLPPPRYMKLKNIINPITNEVLDKGFVVWMPAPKTFTGEDSVEFQVHGSAAVVAAMYNAFQSFEDVRLAEPGEFTKRAFYNQKIDLTAAEGLTNLIFAETEMQRKQAFLQSEGSLRNKYDGWLRIVLEALGDIEALIEFAETDNIAQDNIIEKVTENMNKVYDEIRNHLDDSFRGERVLFGVRVILIGSTNVGKSSLMNKILQRRASIVSNIKNTTRDVVEQCIDIGGYPIRLADTAGLEEPGDQVLLQLAVEQTRCVYSEADMVILVLSIPQLQELNQESLTKLVQDYSKFIVPLPDLINQDAQRWEDLFLKPCIVAINKYDLFHEVETIPEETFYLPDVIFTSCLTDEGIGDIKKTLAYKCKTLLGESTMENPFLSSERQKFYLNPVARNLEHVLNDLNGNNVKFDIVAEHLRVAMRNLGSLTGKVTNDEVLDSIFRRFCVGK